MVGVVNMSNHFVFAACRPTLAVHSARQLGLRGYGSIMCRVCVSSFFQWSCVQFYFAATVDRENLFYHNKHKQISDNN